MKTNKFIDILKLLMAFIVAFHHLFWPSFASSGYLACEFFFFVAGFYMMKKACSTEVGQEGIASAASSFVIKKYLNLLPLLVFSLILSFFAYTIIAHQPVMHVLKLCVMSIPNVLLLQMLGFGGGLLSGIVWFLSAMLIAMLILYPFCLKFKKSVSPFFLLLSIGIYGFLIAVDHDLSRSYRIFGFIFKGTLRGIAGIAAGCVMYHISCYLDKVSLKRSVKTIMIFLSVLCLLSAVFLMLTAPIGESDSLILALLFFCVPPFLCWKDECNKLVPFNTEFIRNGSVCLYLNHYCLAYSLHTLSLPPAKHVVFFLVLSGISTVITLLLWHRTIDTVKVFLRNISVNEFVE